MMTSRFFNPSRIGSKRQKRAPRLTSSSHPIPRLPVLDKLVHLAKQMPEMPKLDKTVFVGTQHLLETTGSLFRSLIELGVKPDNMFFAGKCYSTSPVVAQAIEEMGINVIRGSVPDRPGGYQAANRKDIKHLWEKAHETLEKRDIERVIIVDDGGRTIAQMPKLIPLRYLAASIEQTRGGLYGNNLDSLFLSLIEVASTAVKKHIESPFIAEAALHKLKKYLPNLKLASVGICGVIGYGAIGNAVAEYLLSLGCEVAVYDENEALFENVTNKKLFIMPSMRALIANCSHVFGCTGKDITKNLDLFDAVEGDITLISCASEDREFLSLLEKIAIKSEHIYFPPFSDIVCLSNKRHKITIMKSGFPINFDREPWSVPSEDIAIT